MTECPPRNGFAFDVIGVGALNLDYIVTASQAATGALTTRLAELVERTGRPLEWGTERDVDRHTIEKAIDLACRARPRAFLGGSAFNAVTALAQLDAGLRLGFVGVAGRVPVDGLSALGQLQTLGVDCSTVARADDHLCGICLSYTAEAGDCTLLTHAGANVLMADYLQRAFAELVAYLASARILHVTSFLDADTPRALLAVLQAVKAASPDTLICLDPGHVWSTNLTTQIKGLVDISDYLLVNSREFAALDGQLADGSGVVVRKRPTGIDICRRDGDRRCDTYPQVPLAVGEIEDDTGAGDVFAAGFLAAVARDRHHTATGVRLGMRLARHKLQYVGSDGNGGFAELAREFLAVEEAPDGA